MTDYIMLCMNANRDLCHCNHDSIFVMTEDFFFVPVTSEQDICPETLFLEETEDGGFEWTPTHTGIAIWVGGALFVVILCCLCIRACANYEPFKQKREFP